jgi:hypothetical protein
MGRKSRAKKTRLEVGDVIEIQESRFTLMAGIFVVEEADGPFIMLRAGEIFSGINRECLPPFRKLSRDEARNINWFALQQEYVNNFRDREAQREQFVVTI